MQKKCDCSCRNDKSCKKSEKTEKKDGFKQDSAQKSREYTITMSDNADDNGYSVRFSSNVVISDFSRLIKMFSGSAMDINYTADSQILLSFRD
jgi:hypothetical protein